ncbi:PH domain-containing protein [Sphingobacterium lactis]|uniref:PH domain-containing protein n=1 Tax=Sphingobacterium lactis TaxID=797291 RepID=UPI003F7D3F82
MFHKSRFIIEGNLLKWKILTFSDVINITNIKKLEVGKTKYFGRFIATGENGITIHSRFEKSYITPENNEEMVQALLEINPDIQVIDYTKKQAV